MAERQRLLTRYFPVRSSYVLKKICEYMGVDPSGVNDVATTPSDHRYYNLNGQVVEHPSKGVYINNGKKVVIGDNPSK